MRLKNTLLITISILVIYSGCKSSIPTSSDFFKVANVTCTPWVAGTLAGGRGKDYNIFLEVKKDYKSKILFDSIWVEGYVTGFYKSSAGKFTELIANVKERNELPGQNGESTRLSNPPMPYAGAALISYRVDNRTYYLRIKNITLLQTVNMPE